MPPTLPTLEALAPEDRLLVACCAAAIHDDTRVAESTTEDVLSGEFNWNAFLVRARWHGVHGTILPLVDATLGEQMPETARATLRRLGHEQARHNLGLAEALALAGGALYEADVPFAVLKGLPLAHRLYGTITARRCRDIDLLVPPERFNDARNALEALGYSSTRGLSRKQDDLWLRRAADLPMVHGATGLLLELHHGFEMRPRWAGQACARGLLEAARPYAFHGIEVPAALGTELLPYLAWHGTKHAWFRLFWLLDIAALEWRCGITDRAAVMRSATTIDQVRSLALAWWLSAQLFGVPDAGPDIGAAEARRVAALGHRVLASAFGPVQPPRRHTLVRRSRALNWQLRAARGVAQKLAVIRDYLLAVHPADIQTFPLPPSLFWLYPLLRPLRVLGRLLGAVAPRRPREAR
jgi:hypothetical protein